GLPGNARPVDVKTTTSSPPFGGIFWCFSQRLLPACFPPFPSQSAGQIHIASQSSRSVARYVLARAVHEMLPCAFCLCIPPAIGSDEYATNHRQRLRRCRAAAAASAQLWRPILLQCVAGAAHAPRHIVRRGLSRVQC
ncbi:hypothetical protein LSAT2_021413, partial [Lamellibrachia satsuma]